MCIAALYNIATQCNQTPCIAAITISQYNQNSRMETEEDETDEIDAEGDVTVTVKVTHGKGQENQSPKKVVRKRVSFRKTVSTPRPH